MVSRFKIFKSSLKLEYWTTVRHPRSDHLVLQTYKVSSLFHHISRSNGLSDALSVSGWPTTFKLGSFYERMPLLPEPSLFGEAGALMNLKCLAERKNQEDWSQRQDTSWDKYASLISKYLNYPIE